MHDKKAEFVKGKNAEVLQAYDDAGCPQEYQVVHDFPDGSKVHWVFQNGLVRVIYQEMSEPMVVDGKKLRKQAWYKAMVAEANKDLKLNFKPKGPDLGMPSVN